MSFPKKRSSFAHLKYSNDDHGGFKAAAARPHPHLHHQFSGSRLPQLSSQQDHLCLLQHPSCPAKLQQHSRPPRRPAGNCAWKQKAGSSTAAPTCSCGSRAQLLPCRSCTTMVPPWFHSPAVAFLAACSDLPSLHLACILLVSAAHHVLIPQCNEPCANSALIPPCLLACQPSCLVRDHRKAVPDLPKCQVSPAVLLSLAYLGAPHSALE